MWRSGGRVCQMLRTVGCGEGGGGGEEWVGGVCWRGGGGGGADYEWKAGRPRCGGVNEERGEVTKGFGGSQRERKGLSSNSKRDRSSEGVRRGEEEGRQIRAAEGTPRAAALALLDRGASPGRVVAARGRPWRRPLAGVRAAHAAGRERRHGGRGHIPPVASRRRTCGRMTWQMLCPINPRVLVPGSLRHGPGGGGHTDGGQAEGWVDRCVQPARAVRERCRAGPAAGAAAAARPPPGTRAEGHGTAPPPPSCPAAVAAAAAAAVELTT